MKNLFTISVILILNYWTVSADTQFKQSIGLPDATSKFMSACETPDSGYVLFGITMDTMSNKEKLFLVKMNMLGSLVWSKTYDYPIDVFGTKVAVASNGDLIMTGYTVLDTIPYDDVFLIRAQSDGTIIWSKRYGGDDIDEALDLILDHDKIVMAGLTYSFGPTLKSGLLIKTDGNGNIIWSNAYTQNISQQFDGILKTIDDGYLMTGYTQAPPGINFDGYLVKTDSAGNIDWAKRTGGSGSEFFYKAIQDSAGDFFVCGAASTNSISGNLDGWFLRVDSQSNNLINYTYGSAIPDGLLGIATSSSSNNTVILSGYSERSSGSENALYLPVDKSTGLLNGSGLFAGTNGANARALASFYSTAGLVQAGYVYTPTDPLGSAFVIKYPTLISPCQLGVATLNAGQQFYADSLGSTVDTAAVVVDTIAFISTDVNPIQTIFCILTGTEELTGENKLILSPNPVKDKLKIDFELQQTSPALLLVLDMNGRVVLSSSYNGSKKELQVSQILPGIYQLILNEEGRILREKFVKLD